eukprot:gnl/TRDRNA2_/TRDRNA2_87536_c0_seq2.p2 gnl/TRDRNA2_/TRDRNA2_87536_c0~~gnl/TRDRNA2_/TRDRNA2_87536_c0_seq2.p2  ORF type:complete len:106 (-),score=3.76 gnl/TRDRNA2_/TRDRNA2_87536_c0_seq2:692-1009(-)
MDYASVQYNQHARLHRNGVAADSSHTREEIVHHYHAAPHSTLQVPLSSSPQYSMSENRKCMSIVSVANDAIQAMLWCYLAVSHVNNLQDLPIHHMASLKASAGRY